MSKPKFNPDDLTTVVDSLDKLIDAGGQDLSVAVSSDDAAERAAQIGLKNALDALQGARAVVAGVNPTSGPTVNVGVQS